MVAGAHPARGEVGLRFHLAIGARHRLPDAEGAPLADRAELAGNGAARGLPALPTTMSRACALGRLEADACEAPGVVEGAKSLKNMAPRNNTAMSSAHWRDIPARASR